MCGTRERRGGSQERERTLPALVGGVLSVLYHKFFPHFFFPLQLAAPYPFFYETKLILPATRAADKPGTFTPPPPPVVRRLQLL